MKNNEQRNFHADWATDLFLDLWEGGVLRVQSYEAPAEDPDAMGPQVVSRVEWLRREYERTGRVELAIEAFTREVYDGNPLPTWCVNPLAIGLYHWQREGGQRSLEECLRVKPKHGERSPYYRKEAEYRRDRALCFELFVLRGVVPGLSVAQAAGLIAKTYRGEYSHNGQSATMLRQSTLEKVYANTWGRRLRSNIDINQELEAIRSWSHDERRRHLLAYYDEVIAKKMIEKYLRACRVCSKPLGKSRKALCRKCRQRAGRMVDPSCYHKGDHLETHDGFQIFTKAPAAKTARTYEVAPPPPPARRLSPEEIAAEYTPQRIEAMFSRR
jgi:hypothetical protein